MALSQTAVPPGAHCISEPRRRNLGLAFSPDGRYLASAGMDYPDHTVKVWDATTAQLIHTLRGHSNYIPELAFSDDGKFLASGSVDNTAHVWDAKTGGEISILKGHSSEIWTVRFSSNSAQLQSVDQEGMVKSWDVASGREIRSRTYPTTRTFHGTALSPDKTRLASAGRNHIVKIWDAATGGLVHQLTGHTGNIWFLAFSPDGRRLVSDQRRQNGKGLGPGNRPTTLHTHRSLRKRVACDV